MNLYVGNLSWGVTEDDVRVLFENYGTVDSCKLIIDRETGRSRGFAFVEMNDEDGKKALEELDQSDFNGRALKVNEARRRDDRGGMGGGRRSNDFRPRN